jgi:hypothetical protein
MRRIGERGPFVDKPEVMIEANGQEREKDPHAVHTQARGRKWCRTRSIISKTPADFCRCMLMYNGPVLVRMDRDVVGLDCGIDVFELDHTVEPFVFMGESAARL